MDRIDDGLLKALLRKVDSLGQRAQEQKRRKVKIMEVCGTHTVSFARSGITSLVGSYLDLRSGPGCPVCVTHQQDLDRMFALAKLKDTLIVTFGDMLRVPGTFTTLETEKARGAKVHICYSPLEAVDLAAQNPSYNVILLSIGFETTAPTIAATLLQAAEAGLNNFYLYPALKMVPPALLALLQDGGCDLDGLILPGHVSTVLGSEAFHFVGRFGIPAVVAGFEPLELLMGLYVLLRMINEERAAVENAYSHVVRAKGNISAQRLINLCFEEEPVTHWRGLGPIPSSGYRLAERYAAFDVRTRYELHTPPVEARLRCRCGDIITGKISPFECPLFNKGCTPSDPAGPCMVSSEGACSAYYQYMLR